VRAAEIASQWDPALADFLLERAERMIASAKRDDWRYTSGKRGLR
jgi:hypothetical protein